MQTIVIEMEGGLIQEIEGIPQGMQIVVNDFDTAMSDDDDRLVRIGGRSAYQTVWDGSDSGSARGAIVKDAHACLQEFVNDIEAVGPETVQEDWPDLYATYQEAKRIL